MLCSRLVCISTRCFDQCTLWKCSIYLYIRIFVQYIYISVSLLPQFFNKPLSCPCTRGVLSCPGIRRRPLSWFEFLPQQLGLIISLMNIKKLPHSPSHSEANRKWKTKQTSFRETYAVRYVNMKLIYTHWQLIPVT